MSNVLPNPQYKTSQIVLNESLEAVETYYELIGRVNHDYQERLAEVSGMPTGGSISVRKQGIPQNQNGMIMTVKAIEQQYETIQINTDDIIGNYFSIDPVSLEVSRTPVTDTTHYAVARQIAVGCNKASYDSLKLGTHIYVGDTTSLTVNYDSIVAINQVQETLGIPSMTKNLFIGTRDYGSLMKGVVSTNTFYEKINQDGVEYNVEKYADMPLVKSATLATTGGFASFYPTGADIAFDSLVSSDSYKSCVINLKGATVGDVLSPGDRLSFATTKLLNSQLKMATDVPLQLTVQNTVTAGAGGLFSNVECVCGIAPLQQFDSSTTYCNEFANVIATPAEDEVVRVQGSYQFNVVTVKPGFTFATLGLAPMQTLDIGAWFDGKEIKSMAPSSRNKKNPNAPIQIYTSFDADVGTRQFKMRIDAQPVYKTFVGYNVALLTKYTGVPYPEFVKRKAMELQMKINAKVNPEMRSTLVAMAASEAKLASQENTIAEMQAQIQALMNKETGADKLLARGVPVTSKLS